MAFVHWLIRLSRKSCGGWRSTLGLGVFSALLVITPIGGLPLGRWLISMNANFSIPLTAIVLNNVLANASGLQLLDRKTLLSAWLFGLTAGVLLYPMALGLGGIDPYLFGWGFSWLFVLLLAITAVFLFQKNRFAIILMASILGYDFHLLESQNLLDYLVDPFYVVISGVVLVTKIIRKIYKRAKGHR